MMHSLTLTLSVGEQPPVVQQVGQIGQLSTTTNYVIDFQQEIGQEIVPDSFNAFLTDINIWSDAVATEKLPNGITYKGCKFIFLKPITTTAVVPEEREGLLAQLYMLSPESAIGRIYVIYNAGDSH